MRRASATPARVEKTSTPPDQRARRITRVLYATYILLTAAFTISNIAQVVRVLFLAPEDRGARAIRSEPCRKGLEFLATGLERATAEAAGAHDATAAESAYRAKRSELTSAWRDAESACNTEPNGPEALAAMTRLDRAAEATARRRGEALAPVRREVDSFIR